MKDEILNCISMQDVIDKYGIENNGKMFCCPFHNDKHPSAKIYTNSYYCFVCCIGGDVIHFVENLFSLSFREAMQKINMDFNLGLDFNNVDYDKLRRAKNIQNEKKKMKKKLIRRYSDLCDRKCEYEKVVDILNNKININNWETIVDLTSNYDTRLFQINQELQEIDNKLSSRT